MNIIYITEVRGYLKKEGENLILYKGREKIKEIKTNSLAQIIVVGNIQISTQAMTFLFKKGIDIVFLSLSGKFRGKLSSEVSKNIELRKKQFKVFEKKEFLLDSSRNIVKAKISNQLYF
jgi:CRISPR-associated protein Cas1